MPLSRDIGNPSTRPSTDKEKRMIDDHYEINFYDVDGLHFMHMSAFANVKAAKRAARQMEAFNKARVTIIDWYGCKTVAEKMPHQSKFRTINA